MAAPRRTLVGLPRRPRALTQGSIIRARIRPRDRLPERHPFFAPLVLSRHRTGVLIVVHHVHDEQFGTHFSRPAAALGRWLEGPAARWVYRRCTAVAVSESTIAAMRTRLRWTGPIELVHNGVTRQGSDFPGPRLVVAPVLTPVVAPVPRLVAVGRLVRHKRLDHVAKLADDLAETWPGIEVHIIGRGPDEARIRDTVSRMRHPDRVHLHGYLPAEAKDHLLRAGWLHLSASQGEGWDCRSWRPRHWASRPSPTTSTDCATPSATASRAGSSPR